MQKNLTNNSHIISFLRFPLIVGVVFIHSLSLPHGVYRIYDFFYNSLTEIICGTCVPLFFFFSGYLFFQNIDSFDFNVYLSKLRKRVRSLLIPYIFWNLFVVLLIGVGQLLAPSLFIGAFKNVLDFTVKDWFSIFYCALGSDQPIAFQLWFLRDLIVLTLLTPLIYYLCKYLNFWWLVVLLFLRLLGINGLFPGLNLFSLLFFAVGCWFGINKCSFVLKSLNARYIVSIAFFILFYGIEIVLHERCVMHDAFHCLSLIAGSVAIIQFTSVLIDKKDNKRFLHMKPVINNSTFFIYCYHGIFSSFIAKVINPYTNGDLHAVFWYFMIVLILVVGGIIAYNLLLKVSPVVIRVITGGRGRN